MIDAPLCSEQHRCIYSNAGIWVANMSVSVTSKTLTLRIGPYSLLSAAPRWRLRLQSSFKAREQSRGEHNFRSIQGQPQSEPNLLFRLIEIIDWLLNLYIHTLHVVLGCMSRDAKRRELVSSRLTIETPTSFLLYGRYVSAVLLAEATAPIPAACFVWHA